jgi:hypothetical protein
LKSLSLIEYWLTHTIYKEKYTDIQMAVYSQNEQLYRKTILATMHSHLKHKEEKYYLYA